MSARSADRERPRPGVMGQCWCGEAEPRSWCAWANLLMLSAGSYGARRRYDRAVPGARRSRTAQGVAAERAVLTESGVVDDPYARDLLTPLWSGFVNAVRRWPAVAGVGSVARAGLAARVLWHDSRLTESLDAGVDQVVVIGAGYDTRAWRYARVGVRFFELDHPITQRHKVSRARTPGPTYVGVDLREESAADALVAHGFEVTKPAHFILEGLTMYLTANLLRDQLRDLSRNSGSGSRAALDFHPPTSAGTTQARRLMAMQRLFRSGSGETLQLVVDRHDAVEIVESSNWSVTEAASLRDIATTLLPPDSALPVDKINQHKTVVAAEHH